MGYFVGGWGVISWSLLTTGPLFTWQGLCFMLSLTYLTNLVSIMKQLEILSPLVYFLKCHTDCNTMIDYMQLDYMQLQRLSITSYQECSLSTSYIQYMVVSGVARNLGWGEQKGLVCQIPYAYPKHPSAKICANLIGGLESGWGELPPFAQPWRR